MIWKERIPGGGKTPEILMSVSENQCSPILRGGELSEIKDIDFNTNTKTKNIKILQKNKDAIVQFSSKILRSLKSE